MQYTSPLLQTLHARGFIHQMTDAQALDALLCAGAPVPIYIGFDCTADSLHIGSLLQIMALRHVQKHGHKPIVLMGGGTTRVGDPSGKDASRQLLDDAAITANMAGIKRNFEPFLQFGIHAQDALMVNNADWLGGLHYIDFLREVGRHFSINQMLTMDSVRLRLERESHLSFLEFNYMLLQAYDFVELHKRHHVRVQIGGSDQWGNITQGTDLGRRLQTKPLYGLTTPLLTTANGAKMGKTADGAIWLDAEKCSPYHYWQYWRNVDDADVGRFLRLFTELPLDDIAQLETLEGAAINDAKKRLATEATRLLHGDAAAKDAEEAAISTFEQGAASTNLPEMVLNAALFSDAGNTIPAFKLFHAVGLAKSGGEARKLIQGGGARIADIAVEDELAPIALSQFAQPVKLSAGKKRHIMVRIGE